MGAEGAGRVEAIGAGVENLAPGDRVAWFYHPGSYADLAAVRAESLVKIPEVVDDQTAAAVMMQGLTAHHPVTETYPVAAGDIAVVLAVAGGVGLLLTQMVKAAGGRAIGLVSREDKAPAARGGGADHVLVSSEVAFRTRSGSFPAGAAPTSSTAAAAPTPSAPPSWRCAVTACTPSTGTRSATRPSIRPTCPRPSS
jgi:NADPH:quinone reductase-like Zn-dependent oxidoreductase